MRVGLRNVVIAAAAAAVVACFPEKFLVVPITPGFSTDTGAYIAVPVGDGQVAFRVVAAYRNARSGPVFLNRCRSDSPHPTFVVDVTETSSISASAYIPREFCLAHDSPIVVAAGETRVDTITVRGSTALDPLLRRPLVAVAGTFRMAYTASSCRGVVTCPNDDVPRYSNTFTVALSSAGVIPPVLRDSGSAFQTDSVLYHFSRRKLVFPDSSRPQALLFTGRIGATFHNPTGAPVYVVNCGGSTGLFMEKLVNDAWQFAWTPVTPACLSQPIVIPAGGEQGSPIYFEAAAKGTKFLPEFAFDDLPGVYRLVWRDYLSSYQASGGPFGPAIPIEHRRSNQFAIVLDP